MKTTPCFVQFKSENGSRTSDSFTSHPIILLNALKACREHISDNYDKERDYEVLCVIDEVLVAYQKSIKADPSKQFPTTDLQIVDFR
jgi:hypothetical protein